jgi:multiple antibiotic resistance protein
MKIGVERMTGLADSFVRTFIPLFIVMDVIGNLPIVVSMWEGRPPKEQRRMVHIAVITATVVGLAFLFFGKLILSALRIQVGEFAIAGGIILFALSLRHMMTGHLVDVQAAEMDAVVPVGTPLVVGPATITTLLLLTDVEKQPLYMVLLSFLLNIGITWIVFLLGNQFSRFLGEGGLKAVSRVFNLILAAIGVSMLIRGLELLGVLKLA